MSSKNRYGKFAENDYVWFLEGTIRILCRDLGYKKPPKAYETDLTKADAQMIFVHLEKRSAIFYDYKRFKNKFSRLSYEHQKIIVILMAAHEVRHYYQHRQMLAKKPREKSEIIARWKADEDGEFASLPLHLQPLELDAQLYAIVSIDDIFEMSTSYAVADEEHVTALEKLYVEYFGETDEELFDHLRSFVKEE